MYFLSLVTLTYTYKTILRRLIVISNCIFIENYKNLSYPYLGNTEATQYCVHGGLQQIKEAMPNLGNTS